jgi:hypothetical protein
MGAQIAHEVAATLGRRPREECCRCTPERQVRSATFASRSVLPVIETTRSRNAGLDERPPVACARSTRSRVPQLEAVRQVYRGTVSNRVSEVDRGDVTEA